MLDAPLRIPEFVILKGSFFQGHLVADLTRMGELFPAIELNNGIQPLHPVCHVHGDSLLGHGFGKGQILLHQQAEQFHFVLGKVVLGDTHIAFTYSRNTFLVERLHTYQGQRGVRPTIYQFRRRLPFAD